jgi:hypothetical protein
VKFPSRMPSSKPGAERMSREDAINALQEIFKGYLESKRGLAADVDRLLLKGWPDRKTAVLALSQVTNLVMECEILRFEYLLGHVPLESPIWASLETITRRLHTDWRDTDEKILSDANAAYRDIMRKLDAAERNRIPAALDGPFNDARRDLEFGMACEAFAKRNGELDSEFGVFRSQWPEPSSTA